MTITYYNKESMDIYHRDDWVATVIKYHDIDASLYLASIGRGIAIHDNGIEQNYERYRTIFFATCDNPIYGDRFTLLDFY